jgi:hypothetical protein
MPDKMQQISAPAFPSERDGKLRQSVRTTPSEFCKSIGRAFFGVRERSAQMGRRGLDLTLRNICGMSVACTSGDGCSTGPQLTCHHAVPRLRLFCGKRTPV